MEHYNKEKHYELIKAHMKRASLENRSLDMYPKFENDGDTLFEFIINETDSILIKDREFQELFEDVNGISYYQAMLDYIASVDERSKDQLIINSLEHQNTTSLDNIQCRSFLNQIKQAPNYEGFSLNILPPSKPRSIGWVVKVVFVIVCFLFK